MNHDKLEAIRGDITSLKVDAIVNAANASLLGGGGVDGAIHRAGGPAILDECRRIVALQGGCPTGEAVITGAGNLPARFVIHTVGPVWSGGSKGEPALLQRCYVNSLRLAREHACKTVAFPCISTGVYGYPRDQAAKTAVAAVIKFLEANPDFEKIVFVCFDAENFRFISQALAER